MTLQKLQEQMTTLAQETEAEREHLADALQSTDYARALACQKTLDRLEGKLFRVSSRLLLRPDH
jgi:hypothetical protein